MFLQAPEDSKAVCLLVLLATTGAAMILNELPSPPVASGAADSPAPGGPPSVTSYQDGQSRNAYTYPMGKQYTTYTYRGSPVSQYGSAAPVENVDGSYISYQNGAHVVPQYVSSFRGFSKMAVAKPFTYIIAHPGDASITYQGARSVIDGDVQPENDDSLHTDHSRNINSKAANQVFNPAETRSGQRSLLELLSPQESMPVQNTLFSSLTSSSFLENARVQLSFSGGYPTNSPRYTYLTFIIPGDLCTVSQPGSALANGAPLQEGLKVGNQMNNFVNHQTPYGTTFGTYAAPAVPATYGISDQYQYSGSAVQNQAMYANGPTVYGTLPVVGQTYGVNGGGAGTFLNSLQQHAGALRSLDDHPSNAEDSKSPSSPPEPASGNKDTNESPEFAAASRSIST